MANVPQHILEIARKYEIPKSEFWDCHGTWVCKHRALEEAAARAGVKWSAPVILESSSKEAVALLATGSLGDLTEWSIGEASPKNNKNAYPWAMAEKRAKDRVILKLLGFSGHVYSEEEADDFKDSAPKDNGRRIPDGSVAPLDADGKTNKELRAEFDRLDRPLEMCNTMQDLTDWHSMFSDDLAELPEDMRNSLRGKYARKLAGFKAKAA